MSKIEENSEKTLHLGGDYNAILVKSFRKQTSDRKFKQTEVLRLLIEWWISLDENSQRNFYYQDIKPENLELYPGEASLPASKKSFRREMIAILKELGVKMPKIDKGISGTSDPDKPDAEQVVSRARARRKDQGRTRYRKTKDAG